MQIALYDNKGKKTQKRVKLDDSIFQAEVNPALISQAVYVYLSNQRQFNANTKSRGEVKGGGKKPWRQKGTGRARHGSIRSPIWKGGGVAFGPKSKDIKFARKRLPKKMKQSAIRGAFSYHTKNKTLYVFEGINITAQQKTKSVLQILANAQILGSTLIIQSEKNDDLIRSVSNLNAVDASLVNELNAYKLLKYKNLILLKDSISVIEKYWKL